MASTGLKRKLEGEIELRVGAAEAFHELYQEKPHEISNIHPEFVQACDLHDGAYGTPGSIIYWRYTLGNIALYFYYRPYFMMICFFIYYYYYYYYYYYLSLFNLKF